MALWPFGRKKDDDKSVQTLLDEANAASPTGAPAAATPASDPAPVAQVGDGSFRLPVEDVFMITGRGVVVTGRVEAGTARVGMQVHVVRNGEVLVTTSITGIEAFRKVMDTANPGDNIGVLLKGVTREQLSSGDVIQG